MKKLATTPERILCLDDQPRLGEADGPDRFNLNWEFWCQVLLIFHRRFHQTVGKPVTGENAIALAEMIEALAKNESWRIHLYFWADEERNAVTNFTHFLRGGSFVVVLPSSDFRKF